MARQTPNTPDRAKHEIGDPCHNDIEYFHWSLRTFASIKTAKVVCGKTLAVQTAQLAYAFELCLRHGLDRKARVFDQRQV